MFDNVIVVAVNESPMLPSLRKVVNLSLKIKRSDFNAVSYCLMTSDPKLTNEPHLFLNELYLSVLIDKPKSRSSRHSIIIPNVVIKSNLFK